MDEIFTSLLGSKSVEISGNPTFEQKDDVKVTVKGLELIFDWGSAEIESSPTKFSDDLVAHVTNAMKKMISEKKNYYVEDDSQDAVVVTDVNDYQPTFWSQWSTCDDKTCNQTRNKKCYYESRLPCKEDTTPTEETRTCFDTCGKSTG